MHQCQRVMHMVVQPLIGNRITPGSCPMISPQKYKVQSQAWAFKASKTTITHGYASPESEG